MSANAVNTIAFLLPVLNGFEILSHLPEGFFKTRLHVYINYKEYEYPLKENIIINGSGFCIKEDGFAD